MEDKTNKTQEIDKEIFPKLIGIKEIPKFTQICRVCLCETNESDQKLDTRILLLNNAQEIRSLLQESTGVKIVDLDFLPNHICDRCFKTLTAWYRFRSQTQRSNEILNKYLNKLSFSLDNKSLPSTDLTIHMQGEDMDVVSTQNVSQIQDFQISFVKDKPEVVGFVFHCNSCTMTFTNQLGLDKHQEEHFKPSKQKAFKCEHCPKSFAFRNGLHNHIQFSHHHLTRFKYQCNVCERHYNSPTGFKLHKSKPCVPVDLIEKCKIRKLNVRKEELIAVAEKTIRETKISCILCKKNFKSPEDFISHYPKHKKDRKCHICNKDFTRFKVLERHVRMHLHAKVYACPMCSRSFYTCAAFRAHMKEHGTKEWVYRCNVCQKEFFIVREFEIHMVKHLESKEYETKILEKTKHIDMANVSEIKNGNNIDIDNEFNSNISAEVSSTNELANQMETDIQICQEPFQLVKVEVDFENDPPNKPEGETSIQEEIDTSIDVIDSKEEIQQDEIASQVQSLSQLETDIPIDHESSNQAIQLQNQFNSNDILDKTEISVVKDIVKLETPELDNRSSEEDNADEIDHDISSLSKSNDQISENQSAEYIQTLLDKCKVNCHVAGCQTKCSTLNEIWEHLKRDHLYEKKPFKCSECLQQFKKKNAFRVHIKEYYTFKCPVCFKLKKSSSELKKHVILTHSPDRPFKCSKCDQRFSRPLALKVHETTHNNKKEFICSICSKDFFSNNGLYLHSKSHKDIKELQCPICSRQLSSKYRLKRHIDMSTCSRKNIKFNWGAMEDEKKSRSDVEIPYVNNFEISNECDPNTSAEDDFKNESNYQMEADILTCQDPLQLIKVEEDCEKYTSNKPEKDSSFQTEMDISKEINNSKQLLESEETQSPKDHGTSNQSSQLQSADNDQFNTNAKEVKTALNDFVKLENPELDNSSSEEDNFYETDDDISILSKSNDSIGKNQTSEYTRKLLDKCKVNCHFAGCQTKCSTLTEIWEHFKKEHLTGKKPFKCCKCSEEFEHKMSFRLHIKKYYSFKCPICFKLKINSCELKRHVILAHSKERPFKCSKCSKQFVSSSYLKAHDISHSNKKEFVCNICSRDFFSKNGLYLHLKSHKVIKELQCSICSRQFLSKDHLRRHIEINTCGRKCTK